MERQDGVGTKVSIVVPVRNERPSLEPLLAGLEPVLDRMGRPYEIILVDDGSTDGTADAVAELARTRPNLLLARFPERLGKSAAWSEGFRRATGDLICTMDGDLQNDPSDLPRLIERLEAGADCVSGWRRRRESAFWSRVMPSRAGNLAVRAVTGSRLHDHGCGLKAFRREAVRDLELAPGMHRYVPVLIERNGGTTAEVEVNDRKRIHGASNYGPERILQVPWELLRLSLIDGRPERGRLSVPRFLLLLSLVTLAGLILRLAHLGGESYWTDEMYSIFHATRPLGELPTTLGNLSVHPPLYFALLHIWIALGGTSEFWVRLPSALLGTLTIPALAWFGARLFDRRTGLTAAVLLSISPFHLYYSQEARSYALVGLFTLLSLLAYHRLRRRADGFGVAAYLFTGLVLMYSHVYALLTLLAQNLHFFGTIRSGRVRKEGIGLFPWLGGQVFLAAAFLPWIPSFFRQAGSAERYSWIPPVSWASAPRTLMHYAGKDPWLAGAFAALMAIGAVGLLLRRTDREWRRSFATVLFWGIAPAGVAILISLLVRPIYHSRYTMQTLLMLLLAGGAALSAVVPAGRAAIGAIAVLIALGLPALRTYYGQPQKEQWREAAACLDERSRPDDRVVVICRSPASRMALDHYLKRGLSRYDLEEVKRLAGGVAGSWNRVWIVLEHYQTGPVEDQLLLFPGHRISERAEYKGITVALLEK